MESGKSVLPESSTRVNTGLSASLEAELQDLERHWEDLDRATAQGAAEAQPAAHGTVHPSSCLLAWSWHNAGDNIPCPFVLSGPLLSACGRRMRVFRVRPIQEGHDEEEEERQAQKKVASVVERWESRSISADRATAGRCASSADGSASDAASAAQVPSPAMARMANVHTTHLVCATMALQIRRCCVS